MKQINLKSDSDAPGRKTTLSLSLVIGLSLLIITGLVFGGLFLYQLQIEKKIAIAQDEIDNKEENINENEFGEIYDLQGRIIDIQKYSAESNNQTEVLNVISARTFNETFFESLDLNQSSPDSSLVSGTIIVKDATQLANQLNAYKQSDQIENLKLESSSLEERGTVASLNFLVKSSNDLEK
ncbi:MAG: hypothetical protein PF549_01595 [Patescibacteria group bacterium]|jgi:hypothetical protein|nr:hypothetical protein [Patescibacteria group bacterium]